MNPTDAVLISRVLAADDRDAFGTLVQRYQSRVRQFLRHLTRGNAALADDLAQETFVQAYRGLNRFRAEASFPTWLLGIAHNYWRNARRRERDDVAFDDALAPEPTTNSTVHTADFHHDLASALQQLSADEQLAIHLGYQQGMSHSEIAALLDWPVGTVKTHLARGKDKLRHLLAVWNPQT